MGIVISIFLTIIGTGVLYYVEQRTKFAYFKPIIKQIIIGICFGLIAISSTELGNLSYRGVIINCRDAPIIISGLIFGPWAGIISSVLASAERFFIATPIYDIGTYTQIACSASSLFAGFLSAMFHILIFHKHHPNVLHTIVFVIVIEVFHMIMIPLTHIDDLESANMLMMNISYDICIANLLAAGLSNLVISIMDIRFKGATIIGFFKKRDIFFTRDLFFSFQFWLLLIIIVAFAFNIYIISVLYSAMSLENSQNKFESELKIMKSLVYEDCELFNDEPKNVAIRYASQWTDEKVVEFAVVDESGTVISENTRFKELGYQMQGKREFQMYKITEGDEILFCMYISLDGCKIISYAYEKYEMYLPYFTSVMTTFIQIFVFGLLMFAVFLLLKLLVGNNLEKINSYLFEITKGNLNEHVDVYNYKEFAVLSDSINATVDTLKKYIDEEANRYTEEFQMAKQIQLSALPSVFPPFPNDPEIDFYAKYNPAKMVGGDFYDYYYVSKNTLAFLIADVSGKGIPAAMFMMRAKTAFRVFADKNSQPNSVLEAVNNYLCENNEAEMFVTCWFGLIDVRTGKMDFASAGHNPPILISDDGSKTSFLKTNPSLVLGAMEGVDYVLESYTFRPGEKLLLYTDGVTEAHNKNSDLYGEERLLEDVVKYGKYDIKDLCENITDEVDIFSRGVEQFDDFTVLTFVFKGEHDKLNIQPDFWESEITVFSRTENVNRVIERCEETLELTNCPPKFIMQFNVCIDEIFSNICKYGYKSDNQYISVRFIVDEREDKKFVKLTFWDTAERFNPLDQSSPDTTLSAEERQIGGLGIFMVRQMTDDMFYEYMNGANWLTIVKYYEK